MFDIVCTTKPINGNLNKRLKWEPTKCLPLYRRKFNIEIHSLYTNVYIHDILFVQLHQLIELKKTLTLDLVSNT